MLNSVSLDVFKVIKIQQAAVSVLNTLEEDKTVSVAKDMFENILEWGENQELNADFVYKKLLERLKSKVLNSEEKSPALEQRVLAVAMNVCLSVRGVTEENQSMIDTPLSIMKIAVEVLYINQTDLFDSAYWQKIVQQEEIFRLLSVELKENMEPKKMLEKLVPFIEVVDALVESGGAPRLCKYLEGILSNEEFNSFAPLLRSVKNLVQSVEFSYHEQGSAFID